MKFHAAAFLAATSSYGLADVRMESNVNTFESDKWEMTSASPADLIRVRVALKHEEAARQKLHTALMEVSTPSNDRYGQHLTRSEIKNVLNLDKASTEKVFSHFEGVEGAEVSVNGFGDIISE